MMEINLSVVIPVAIGMVTLGGFIVRFFQMQTKQNMKIEELEKAMEKAKCEHERDVNGLGHKITEQTGHQIQTEKAVVEINTKLDSIMEAIRELKTGQAKG